MSYACESLDQATYNQRHLRRSWIVHSHVSCRIIKALRKILFKINLIVVWYDFVWRKKSVNTINGSVTHRLRHLVLTRSILNTRVPRGVRSPFSRRVGLKSMVVKSYCPSRTAKHTHTQERNKGSWNQSMLIICFLQYHKSWIQDSSRQIYKCIVYHKGLKSAEW